MEFNIIKYFHSASSITTLSLKSLCDDCSYTGLWPNNSSQFKDEQFSRGITMPCWKKVGIRFKRLGFQFRSPLISFSDFFLNAHSTDCLNLFSYTMSVQGQILYLIFYTYFCIHDFNLMLILISYYWWVSLVSNRTESWPNHIMTIQY